MKAYPFADSAAIVSSLQLINYSTEPDTLQNLERDIFFLLKFKILWVLRPFPDSDDHADSESGLGSEIGANLTPFMTINSNEPDKLQNLAREDLKKKSENQWEIIKINGKFGFSIGFYPQGVRLKELWSLGANSRNQTRPDFAIMRFAIYQVHYSM